RRSRLQREHSCCVIRSPSSSPTPFPYTTLFRSEDLFDLDQPRRSDGRGGLGVRRGHHHPPNKRECDEQSHCPAHVRPSFSSCPRTETANGKPQNLIETSAVVTFSVTSPTFVKISYRSATLASSKS